MIADWQVNFKYNINGDIKWNIKNVPSGEYELTFKVTDKDGADAEKTVSVNIPDKAVVTYTRQEKEQRNMLHLLYAHTTVRGVNTEVIEDTVPLYNVKCSVKCDKKPSKISLVPSGEELDFDFSNSRAEFTVPEVNIHQMVVIEE